MKYPEKHVARSNTGRVSLLVFTRQLAK